MITDWTTLRQALIALLDHAPLWTVGERGWTLTTGAPPFDGGSPERSARLAAQGRPPPFLPRWPVPPGLDAWLLRLLSRDQPFTDLSEARAALLELGPARRDPGLYALEPDAHTPDPLRSTDAPIEPDPLDGGREVFSGAPEDA